MRWYHWINLIESKRLFHLGIDLNTFKFITTMKSFIVEIPWGDEAEMFTDFKFYRKNCLKWWRHSRLLEKRLSSLVFTFHFKDLHHFQSKQKVNIELHLFSSTFYRLVSLAGVKPWILEIRVECCTSVLPGYSHCFTAWWSKPQMLHPPTILQPFL